MVNTVLGKIPANALGITLCHEHVFVGSGDMAKAFGNRYMQKEVLVALAVKQITEAREKFGLNTIIDGTPIDLGRDADLLRQVSLQSGVNIIASSGLYCDTRAFMAGRQAETLAGLFVDECLHGMENTYQTAAPVLPGILKCATDHRGVTEDNALVLKAVAMTQKATGLPVFAHNEHAAKTAPCQLKILTENGAAPEKIIIGHASDTTDIPYLESLLQQGVFLGFDRIYCKEEQADTLCGLLDKGYGDRILLSRDGAAFLDFGDRTFESESRKEENTYCTVLGPFCGMLRARGVHQSELHKMLVTNLQRLFA